jgi:hypothetical protein
VAAEPSGAPIRMAGEAPGVSREILRSASDGLQTKRPQLRAGEDFFVNQRVLLSRTRPHWAALSAVPAADASTSAINARV